jgi:hypothetical protein
MKRIGIQFMPLDSGESPGDPELGGWRPLRLHFPTRPRVLSLSVGEAARVVAARLVRFQLCQAINIVACRLSK